MATTVAEVMTTDPATVDLDAPVSEAARAMRASDVGGVLVLDRDRDSALADISAAEPNR